MKTLADLRDWLASAPPGTQLDAAALREILQGVADAPERPQTAERQPQPAEPTWRERLWTAPAETRIGPAELLEATGRPRSWLYRHTGAKAKDRIPHRKFDGELVFLVGEVRRWLKDREEIIEAGPIEEARADLRAI